MRALAAALLATVASLAAAPAAHAVWAPDAYSTQVAVCQASGTQTNFSACSDGAGGVFVAWVDQRPGASTDIYAQRINASGNAVWATDGVVICGSTGIQNDPQIVSDGSGGAIIVWVDRRSLTHDDLYAQRLNASGMRQWASNGIQVTGATGHQRNPSVAADGAGGFVVCWQDERSAPTTPDVYAQRVNTNGALLWTSGGLTVHGMPVSVATTDEANARIASDGAGGAIVAWSQELSVSEWDVYVQRLAAASGAEMWTSDGVPLVDDPGQQFLHDVAPDGAGGMLVTYNDRNGGNVLKAQRVNSSGVARWLTQLTELGDVNDKSSSSTLVADGSGGLINVQAYSGCPTLQRLGTGGTPAWTPPGVQVDNVSGWGQSPRIVADGAGGVIVAYFGAYGVIRAGRLNGAGSTQWPGTWVPVQSAYYAQALEMVATSDQRFIVVFQTYHDAGDDLHVQRFDLQGALGAPEPVISGVDDIPNDQGGRVRVAWSRSDRDVESLGGIVDYRVWRSVPVAALAADGLRASRRTSSDADEAAHTGGVLVLPESANGYAWELVATQAAASLAEYSVVTDTESDSIPGSHPLTAFMVEACAGTAATSQRWFSLPDSGYSVDDLAPAQPQPFAAVYGGATTQLHWGANSEPDLAFYRIHRGADPDFVPDDATFVGETADTTLLDAAPRPLIYKLIAVDVHGNASPWAIAIPSGTVGVDGPAGLRTLSLSAPQPNPVRAGVGTLRFALPSAGRVTLRLFDPQGRLRATLVDGSFEPGEHGTDLREAGRLPAGIYLARLDAPGGVRTRRVVVVD